MRLLITRPQPQASQWVDALRTRGIDAQSLPLIGIEPMADGAAVAAAWLDLASFGLVVFVSPNAVSQFFLRRPAAVEWPGTLAAATPGPGSAAALRGAGVTTLIEPAADAAHFDSESLWQELGACDWQGKRVLIVRGDGGRDWLAQRLLEAGAQVTHLQAYCRTLPALNAGQHTLLEHACAEPHQHLWHFSSSQAIDHLEHIAPACRWAAARALASHPRIAERARRLGIGDVREVAPRLDAVAALLAQR